MNNIRSYNQIINDFKNNPMTIYDCENNILLANELNRNLQYLSTLLTVNLQNRLKEKISPQEKNSIQYLLDEQRIYLSKATEIKSIMDIAFMQKKQFESQLNQNNNIQNKPYKKKDVYEIYFIGTYKFDNPYLSRENNNYANSIFDRYHGITEFNKYPSISYRTIGGVPHVFRADILCDYDSIADILIEGERYINIVNIFTGKKFFKENELYLEITVPQRLSRNEVIQILNSLDNEKVQFYKIKMNQIYSELLQFYDYAYQKQQQDENEIKLKLSRLGSEYYRN